MKLFKYLVLLFFFSCKNEKRITDQYISNDSVIVNLKKLKETELTRIEIIPGIFFADTIQKGQVINGEFVIFNKGNQPFLLKKIINVCDCTVTQPTKKEVQPKDSCYIKFKINTDNFNEGFNVRMITIIGNFHPFFRVLSVECFVGEKII